MSKKWKVFPLALFAAAYITNYAFFFDTLDSDQLFPLHKIKYNVSILDVLLSFKTTSPRPDTKYRTEQRIVKFSYSYHEEWDLKLPIPREAITIDFDIIYYNRELNQWLKHKTTRRVNPGNGSFIVTINPNLDTPTSYNSKWISFRANNRPIDNLSTLIPYNKQYNMHCSIEDAFDSTKPQVPPKYYRRYYADIDLIFIKSGSTVSDVRIKVDSSNNNLFNDRFYGGTACEFGGYLEVNSIRYNWSCWMSRLNQFGVYTQGEIIWDVTPPSTSGIFVVDSLIIYFGDGRGNNIVRTQIANDNNELIAAQIRIKVAGQGNGEYENYITLDRVPLLTGDLTPIN